MREIKRMEKVKMGYCEVYHNGCDEIFIARDGSKPLRLSVNSDGSITFLECNGSSVELCSVRGMPGVTLKSRK